MGQMKNRSAPSQQVKWSVPIKWNCSNAPNVSGNVVMCTLHETKGHVSISDLASVARPYAYFHLKPLNLFNPIFYWNDVCVLLYKKSSIRFKPCNLRAIM